MKAVSDVRGLAGAVAAALRACPAKHKTRILTHLRLHAASDGVSVTGTDLDIAVEATAAARVESGGAAVLPAEPFAGLLAGMSGDVAVETDSKAATIRRGRSRFKLPALPPEDFPEPLALSDGAVAWEFTTGDIAALRTVNSASSDDWTRYSLRGVHLHGLDGRLAMVATDGVMLIREHTGIACPDGPGIIVPRPAVDLITRVYVKSGATLRTDGKRIEATAGDAPRLVSKLVDAVYPDYLRVLPDVVSAGVTLDTAEFAQALSRLSAVAAQKIGDDPGAVIMWNAKTSPGEVHLILGRRGDGEGSDVLNAETAGVGHTGFKIARMAALIAALDAPRVRLSAAGNPASPIRADPVGRPSMMSVVMPFRVTVVGESAA
jgi:DNA polymerase-3 subunit beta